MALNGNKNTDYYNEESAKIGGYMTAPEISEELFRAIDVIVTERLKAFKFDKTIEGQIIGIEDSSKGAYRVTTDNNLTFIAYSDNPNLIIGQKVYIRIPDNDYTKRKIITSLYEPIQSGSKEKQIQDSESTYAATEEEYQEGKKSLIRELLDRNRRVHEDVTLTKEQKEQQSIENVRWYIAELNKLGRKMYEGY